jgi:4-oxalocrotonate tautomerase
MPYVSVRVAGKLSRDQKKTIAKEISETLLRVASKPKESTYIVFDEVDRENWAKGEDLLA